MTATATGMVLLPGEAACILRALGFRVDTTGQYAQAVEVFQDAFRLGPKRLRVDGDVGPATTEALAIAETRRRARRTTMSPHFSFSEFVCRCALVHPGCRGVLIVGALVDALEQLRTSEYPGGLSVGSGYRCPQHNTAVGGAPDSQHLHGTACDVAQVVPLARLRRARLFSGLGFGRRSGRVRHVDVRHAGPSRTGATVDHPAEWIYNDS